MSFFNSRVLPIFLMLIVGSAAMPHSALAAIGLGVPTNETGPKEWIADLAAWSASQGIKQTIVKSLVNFINGKGNGTGESQFITDIAKHLQRVGDTKMISFVTSFANRSDSPFAAAIASSLQSSYAEGSSLAGFFAANQDTLSRDYPEINSFLSGDFKKGGWSAWFSLTTQDQNNPFALYTNAQTKLSGVITDAASARSQEVSWGEGFVSWCDEASDLVGWDTCTALDGTKISIDTPGVIIKTQLEKALGSDIDKIVQADELSEIIGTAAIQFAFNILGGEGGGLSGASKPDADGRAPIDLYGGGNLLDGEGGELLTRNTIEYAQSIIDLVTRWENDWQALDEKAKAAHTAAQALIEVAEAETGDTKPACWTEDPNAVATDARAAIIGLVNPVLSEAQAAFTTANETLATATRLQIDARSTDANVRATLGDRVVALGFAPPTSADIQKAEEQVRVTGEASASPKESLGTVSGGTMMDRMALIEKNAIEARTACFSAMP